MKRYLVLIFLLGFFLRIVFLQNIPDGFYRDEASVGYNAYSIVKTGRDEFGKRLPFLFESLEDYKLPIDTYTAAPFVYAFGLDDFWVRFPTMLFGALTPLALFFLVRQIANEKTALLSAFSLAVSPWHILFSRSVNESTISVFTCVAGIYFFLRLVQKWTFPVLVLTAFFTILSVFTYRTQFIFMPLMIFALIIRFHSAVLSWSRKERWYSLFFLFAFLFSLVWVINITRTTRLQEVGLQYSQEIRAALEEQIREDTLSNQYISRQLHNKLIVIPLIWIRNYVSHFDPSYLFFYGDRGLTNNSLPYMGYLLFVDLPVLIIGLLSLLRNRHAGFFAVIVLWILIGPVASSLTVDSPNALRNLISSIGFCMILGYGLSTITDALLRTSTGKIFISVMISLLYIGNLIYFEHQFSVHQNAHSPWVRDRELKKMVQYAMANQDGYDRIVYPNYPDLYIFLLYYGKIDPAYIQLRRQNNNFIARKEEMVHLINSKYILMESDCITSGNKSFLYICVKDRLPLNAEIIQTIRYSDSHPAFTFIRFDGGMIQTDQNSLPSGYSPQPFTLTQPVHFIPEK